MSRFAIATGLLLIAACDGSAAAGPSSASSTVMPPPGAPSTPRASEIPPEATTTPSPHDPPAPACSPSLRIAPRTLAVSWPSHLGRRVSFSCRAVRRIDFVRTLVVADGARLVIMGPADVAPCSVRPSTFIVTGSTIVPDEGRTALPELLLEEDGGCSR